MRIPALGIWRAPAIAVLLVAAPGCIIQSPRVRSLDIAAEKLAVTTPVKAHMLDGSTVMYPYGMSLYNGKVIGRGKRYLLELNTPFDVVEVPLDSVVGMEAYDRNMNEAATIAASSVGAVAGVVGGIVILKAIFGSCPTFYADSAGTEMLQAEGFSYSVAPLLEQRDVDRLSLTPDSIGRVVLRVRNEALETHYINHIGLLEVLHEGSERVMPDQRGQPVAVRDLTPPVTLEDRARRDLSRTLASVDQVLFSSSERVLNEVTENDLDDWIEMTIPAPREADSIAVVVDLRNSLLNTVLLYDHVLGAPGIRSLDFLGKDLANISDAIRVGRWYTEHMGLRVSVWDGTSWKHVTRIGDSGPIAYHQLALVVPVIADAKGVIRLRMSFVADNWRIDAVRAGGGWRRPMVREIEPSGIALPNVAGNSAALGAVRAPDDKYLTTSPGDEVTIEFEAGPGSGARTFLLASQGYYIEWVRGTWIKAASGKPFEPSRATLLAAVRDWRSKQPEFERTFYSTKIATRESP